MHRSGLSTWLAFSLRPHFSHLAPHRPACPQADKELLSKELPNLRPECVRVLELTTALLQRCAEAGMTLYEIATVVSRPFVDADEDPSELEKVCDKAKRCFEVGGGAGSGHCHGVK